eukprot:6600124-Pyramimonas_sp.AAC.1
MAHVVGGHIATHVRPACVCSSSSFKPFSMFAPVAATWRRKYTSCHSTTHDILDVLALANLNSVWTVDASGKVCKTLTSNNGAAETWLVEVRTRAHTHEHT